MFNEFIDLDAWREARILVNSTYKVTRNTIFSKDFGLKEQIQKASVSVMSNIAEGSASKSSIEFIRFLTISRRSSNEVQSLLYIASDQKYISKEEFDNLIIQAKKVSQIINGLIRHLHNKISETTSKRNNE